MIRTALLFFTSVTLTSCAGPSALQSRAYNACVDAQLTNASLKPEAELAKFGRELASRDDAAFNVEPLTRAQVEAIAGSPVALTYGEDLLVLRVSGPADGKLWYVSGDRTWSPHTWNRPERTLVGGPRKPPPPLMLSLTRTERHRRLGVVEVLGGTILAIGTLGLWLPRGHTISDEEWREIAMSHNALSTARHAVHSSYYESHPTTLARARLADAMRDRCSEDQCTRTLLFDAHGTGEEAALRFSRSYHVRRGAAWWDLRTQLTCEVRVHLEVPLDGEGFLAEKVTRAFSTGPRAVRTMQVTRTR